MVRDQERFIAYDLELGATARLEDVVIECRGADSIQLAGDGRLIAQGFEAMQPATALLRRHPAESSNAPATASDGPRQISPS